MLSVVVPIYNEEENVNAFHHAVVAEIVYVNDGSRDSSLALLLEIQRQDPRVTVVEFSRNFGHQSALTAGLQTAKGGGIILMDAWRGGAKVVIAERTSRAERGIRGRLFPLFYKIMGLISDYPIPLNAGIFGLLDRQAADAIINLQEGNRYLPGLRAWVGFPTAFVYYERADRAAGKPKQTLLKLFKYAMDAIFSFSYKPLRLGMALGGTILACTLFLSLVSLGNTIFHLKWFGIVPGNGHIGTLLAILFLGSIQLICTGLLGEYIGRIYDEVRRRPLYLVHKVHRPQALAETVLSYQAEPVLTVVKDSAA